MSSDSNRVRVLSATTRSVELNEVEDYDGYSTLDEDKKEFSFELNSTSLNQQLSQVGFRQASESHASSTNAERAQVLQNTHIDQEWESELGASRIGPDKTECGTLTLYTCVKDQSNVTGSSVNVTSSCRVDAYARLEKANLLRCRANLSELLSRFALESSVMGMTLTNDDVSFHYLCI